MATRLHEHPPGTGAIGERLFTPQETCATCGEWFDLDKLETLNDDLRYCKKKCAPSKKLELAAELNDDLNN